MPNPNLKQPNTNQKTSQNTSQNTNQNTTTSGAKTLVTALKNTFAPKSTTPKVTQTTTNRTAGTNVVKPAVNNRTTITPTPKTNTSVKTNTTAKTTSSISMSPQERAFAKQKQKNRETTEKIFAGQETNGYIADKNDYDKINQYAGVVLDKRTGQQADAQYVNNLYDAVNTKSQNINSSVEKLNADYSKGLVDQDTYLKSYNNLKKEWDDNQNNAGELSNYQYLSGKEYYDWIKQNGTQEEIEDFEAYVGSFDDSMLESAVNSFKAAIVDAVATPFHAYDMIKSVITQGESANEGTSIGMEMKQTADELRSYTLNGANDEGLRSYTLQTVSSLMPMIVDTAIGMGMGSLAGITEAAKLAKFAGNVTNVMMGIGSANETLVKRLEEGNSFGTSFVNGVLHGTITGLVEGLNMGNVANITNLLGNSVGLQILGDGLLSMPKFAAMAYEMHKNGKEEAAEELIESLAVWATDNITNAVLGLSGSDERLSVDPLAFGGIGESGLTDQMIMAYAGSFLLGIPTNTKITVDSIRKYNAAGQARIFWNESAEYYRAHNDLQNAETCDKIVQLIDQERQTYFDKSQLKDAVKQEQDQVENAPTVEAILNSVANAFKLDVDSNIQAIEQKQAEMMKTVNNLQEAMNRRGYSDKINLETYAKATPEVRDASKKVMDFANAIGADMRITDNFDYVTSEGDILNKQMELNRNGVAVHKNTIVLNPFASDIVNDPHKAMMKTFSHELTHTLENTGKYETLKNTVKDFMGEDWDTKSAEIAELYRKNGESLSPKGIDSEVVANFIEENLGNAEFLQTISNYNESAFTKIYTGMKALLNAEPTSKVAQAFFQAYDERINTAMKSKSYVNVFGDLISASDCQFNIAQYREKGKDVLVKYADKQVANGSISREDADNIISTLDWYADEIETIMNDPDHLFEHFSNWQNVSMTVDHNGNPQLTCIVSNGEYKMNIDFSTVCKKRKVADAVFNRLAKEGFLDKKALAPEDIATLRDIVKRNDLEVACGLCFVDSKRFNQGGWADTLLNGTEKKVEQKLVDLGIQDPETGHVLGWNEMVDLLAGNAEVGTFNFAGRESVNEGTLHTLKNSELNRKGLAILKKAAELPAQSEVGKMARALVNHPELRKHMLLGDLYGSEAFGNIKRGMGLSKEAANALFKIVNGHQGVAKPKSPYVEVTYNNEIISSRDKTFQADKAREVGGVRLQSFSDFMTNMVFDYMEAIAEMQMKGLTAHSYTKVQEYAELFGQTGMKINLSIIPKASVMSAKEFIDLSEEEQAKVKEYSGLEKFTIEEVENMDPAEKEKLINERGLSLSQDGSCYTAYIFEDESYNWLDALELQSREGYDKNVGTICVGVSDEHIWKMLMDDNVKMVIPYHKSSLNHIVAQMLNIGAYNDYTDTQNTRVFKDGEWKSINSKGIRRKDFSFYANKKGMINNGYDAKATSRAYLEWCAEKGYLPKFDKFAYIENSKGDWTRNEDGSYSYVGEGNGDLSINDNYYKLLIDFRAYDGQGNIAAQEEVKQNYPSDFMDILKNSMLSYEERLNKQDAAMPQIVEEAKQALTENELQSSISSNDDLQFSLKEDLEAEGNQEARDNLNDIVDNIVKGIKPEENQLIYKHTPVVIQRYGAGDHRFIISPNEIMKAVLSKKEAEKLGYDVKQADSFHSLGKEGFNQAINNISEPVLILKGKNAEGKDKLTVFTETFDYKNRQVIVPILINDQSQYNRKYDEYNVAMSVHGRSSIRNFIQNQIDGGAKVVYYDKKKIQKLNVEGRVQYPASVISVFNDNISPPNEIVKDDDLQSSISNSDGGGGNNNTINNQNSPEGPERPEVEVLDGYGETKKQQFRESNLEKSSVLNEEQKERTRELSAEGYFSYSSLINNVEVQRAMDYMKTDGEDKTYDSFINNDHPSVKTIVQGEILLQELARKNDPRWESVATKLANDATEIGQALQAYSILQRLSPQGQIVAIKRAMNRMQQKLDNRLGNKSPRLKINEALETELMNAQTAEEAQKVRDKIMDDLIKQQPKTFTDMLNSWRYLAMLGNPRTHFRNIAGNMFFSPMVDIKNAIGTVLESIAGSKLKYRTKAFINLMNESDNALYKAGEKAYENHKSIMEQNQKYEQRGFSDKTIVGKVFNKVNDFNSWALDAEDFFFSKRRYAISYAQFLKANNLTAETLTPEMEKRANAYALLESEKATYRDANKLASWLNQLENSERGAGKMAALAKNAILPFTKTPFNIVKRGIEYSPVGLLNTIAFGAGKVRNGEIDVNTWLDSMASGMTGTAVMLLGMLLRNMGLFRTKDDDKDRKKYFDQENGEQDYSIDLGSGTYTIDWMSPVIMPLAMGAELYDSLSTLEGIDGAESALNAFTDISANIFDPVVETSMLSSLKDAMKSYSNEGGRYFGDVVTSMLASYVGQHFPTLGGQIARTIDDTRRVTSPNKGLINKTWKQILNKIPFASKLNQPYINKKGQEEKTEDLGMGWVGRAFLNMVSPGYYKSKDIDKYDEEMYRLYEQTGEIDVLPSSTSKAVEYDNNRFKFTDAEYTQWHRTRYQTESEFVNSFMDSGIYDSLSDDEKVATIKDIRTYAQKVAKKEFLESKGYIYTDNKELAESDPKYIYDKELVNATYALDNNIELHTYYNYLNNAGTKQAEKIAYLEGLNLSQEQKEALYNLSGYKTSYQDAYNKAMGKKTSGKKKSSKGSKKGSGETSTKTKKVSTKKATYKLPKLNETKTASVNLTNNYLRAYSNTLVSLPKANTGGSTVTCPNCHNRVTPYNGRCPVCGNSL